MTRNALTTLTAVFVTVLLANAASALTVFVPPNGDFSSTTLGNNSADENDLDAGWFAKNATSGTINWVIQGGVLDNIDKTGSRTRAGNYFTFNNAAGTGTGWSLEFDLGGLTHTGGDNLLRAWGGKLDGAPNGTAFSSGNNNAPDDDLVVGVWDEIINFSLASAPLGHKIIPITDDISGFDVMVIKMRHQTDGAGNGGPTYDNFQLTNPAGASAIPEPSTMALGFIALLILGSFGWRRRLTHYQTLVLSFVAASVLFAGTVDAALVGHWKLDEVVGPTVFDSSPQGNNGTTGAGTTLGFPGVANTAADFDGTNPGINANMGGDWVTGDGARTITAWFNADTFSNGQQGIFGNGAQTGNFTRFDVNAETDGGNESIMFRYQGGNIAWSGNAEIGGLVVDTWYHLAMVVPNAATFGDVDVYVNGTPLTADGGNMNSLGTSLSTTGNMNIGDNANEFNGTIDDVQYYNEELSASDILSLFNNPGLSLGEIGAGGNVIPEPSAMILATFGLLSLGFVRCRRCKRRMSRKRSPISSSNDRISRLHNLVPVVSPLGITATILALFLLGNSSQAFAVPITAYGRSGVDVGSDATNPANGPVWATPPTTHPPNAVGTVTTSRIGGVGNGSTPQTFTYNVVDTATGADFDFDIVLTSYYKPSGGASFLTTNRRSGAVDGPTNGENRNRTELLAGNNSTEFMRTSVSNIVVNSGPPIFLHGWNSVNLQNVDAGVTGVIVESGLTSDPGAGGALLAFSANGVAALAANNATSIDWVPTAGAQTTGFQAKGFVLNFDTTPLGAGGSAIPEPSTLILASLAMMGLFCGTHRRRRRA